MDTQLRNLMNPALPGVTMNVLRAAFAVLLAAGLLYLHDRGTTAMPANGSEELNCRVGAPAPAIDLTPS